MPTIITILAVFTAVIAACVALQVAQRERARSAARVSALADFIDPPADDELSLFAAEEPHQPVAVHPVAKVGIGGSTVALAVLVIAAAGYLTSVFVGRPAAPVTDRNYADAPGGALALVSMRHARQGDTLTVTGLVRNDDQRRTEPLVAVVFAFDKAGDFVASARAPIDLNALSPGDESPFRVAVPNVPDVGRYRVSFRTETGPVRHIDRRADDPRRAGGLRTQTAS